MPNIILIEDDPGKASGAPDELPFNGDRVGSRPARLLGRLPKRWGVPDLISLQLVLPRREGYRVLRALREEGVDVPMAIVTAHSDLDEDSPAVGPNAKDNAPAAPALVDVVARLEALLARGKSVTAAGGVAQSVERFGDVAVDLASRSVRRSGAPIPLTPLEFDLLHTLIQRRGAVVTRLELLREVWGYSAGATSRTVDTHIANLRRKLEADPSSPRHILTVWKAGYRLQP